MTEGYIPIALSSPIARQIAPPASKKATPASKHARPARKEATPIRKELPTQAATKQPPPEEAPRDEPEAAPRKAFKLVNAMITRRIQGHAGTPLNSNTTAAEAAGLQSQPHTIPPAGDSNTSPGSAASTSPIPQTPLRRVETFISRDTEVQDRMIRGEVVSTRRPSVVRGRGRGATFSGQRAEMEAWWRQPQPSTPNVPLGESGGGPNRKNTA